jgi:hypothetical protein
MIVMEKVKITMSDELIEKYNDAKRRIVDIINNQDMGFISYAEMKERINCELKNL